MTQGIEENPPTHPPTYFSDNPKRNLLEQTEFSNLNTFTPMECGLLGYTSWGIHAEETHAFCDKSKN